MAPTRFAMLSPTNQFSFGCPIFGVETKMRQCVKLVEVTKVNQKLEVRKGCQACISAGKCPVDVMSRMLSFNQPGVEPSDYASAEPRKGTLENGILRRIARVIVPSSILERFGVPDNERQLIEAAHERMMRSVGTLEAEADKPAKRKRASKPAAAPEAPTPTRVNKAAETGDLSAAL